MLGLAKQLWLSLPKTLTHNPNPLNETVEKCRCRNKRRKKNYAGGPIRQTFSETVNNRRTILTLPLVLSAVCIVQN